MSIPPAYAWNPQRFQEFHDLQRTLSLHLAGHPDIIRRWLDAQPLRGRKSGESGGASKSWRTARLNFARRRELEALLDACATPGSDRGPLAAWLLSSVPVRTYLDIAESARPGLGASDPGAEACCRRLTRLRDALFQANYGLARAAAMASGGRDYNDRLSAASSGLLDAIDRYVPGAESARFGYFASYWIRYHVSRHVQKFGSLVSFPINQHRIGRRIDRLLSERDPGGRGPALSEREICAELKIGPNAYHWSRFRPRTVSLHEPAGPECGSPPLERVLSDPAPEPSSALDEEETALGLRALVREHVRPDIRVMLACARGLGALPEAAEDYLAGLHDTARTRVRQLADGIRRRGSSRERAGGTA